jgi:hypothetical protein
LRQLSAGIGWENDQFGLRALDRGYLPAPLRSLLNWSKESLLRAKTLSAPTLARIIAGLYPAAARAGLPILDVHYATDSEFVAVTKPALPMPNELREWAWGRCGGEGGDEEPGATWSCATRHRSHELTRGLRDVVKLGRAGLESNTAEEPEGTWTVIGRSPKVPPTLVLGVEIKFTSMPPADFG